MQINNNVSFGSKYSLIVRLDGKQTTSVGLVRRVSENLVRIFNNGKKQSPISEALAKIDGDFKFDKFTRSACDALDSYRHYPRMIFTGDDARKILESGDFIRAQNANRKAGVFSDIVQGKRQAAEENSRLVRSSKISYNGEIEIQAVSNPVTKRKDGKMQYHAPTIQRVIFRPSKGAPLEADNLTKVKMKKAKVLKSTQAKPSVKPNKTKEYVQTELNFDKKPAAKKTLAKEQTPVKQPEAREQSYLPGLSPDEFKAPTPNYYQMEDQIPRRRSKHRS